MKTCCRFERGTTLYDVHGCMQVGNCPRGGALTAPTSLSLPSLEVITLDHNVDAARGSVAVPRLVLIRAEWDTTTVCRRGAVPRQVRLGADGHSVKAVSSAGGAATSCDAYGPGDVPQ